ncbi:hypothetical protein ACQ4LE_005244 [Meloidogyne hapla]
MSRTKLPLHLQCRTGPERSCRYIYSVEQAQNEVADQSTMPNMFNKMSPFHPPASTRSKGRRQHTQHVERDVGVPYSTTDVVRRLSRHVYTCFWPITRPFRNLKLVSTLNMELEKEKRLKNIPSN